VLDVREHLRDSQISVRVFPLIRLPAGEEAEQRDQTSGDAIPTHKAHSSAAGFWTRRQLQRHICHLSLCAAALTAARLPIYLYRGCIILYRGFIPSTPYVNSFVLGPAVINTHTVPVLFGKAQPGNYLHLLPCGQTALYQVLQ
jgi:hypothetical protein